MERREKFRQKIPSNSYQEDCDNVVKIDVSAISKTNYDELRNHFLSESEFSSLIPLSSKISQKNLLKLIK